MIPATTAAELIEQSGLTLSPEALSLVALVERHLKPKAARKPAFHARPYLLSLGVQEKHADAWIACRRARKPTQFIIDGICVEAEKAGISIDDAIRYAAFRGWATFDHKWYERAEGRGQPMHKESRSKWAHELVTTSRDREMRDERVIDV